MAWNFRVLAHQHGSNTLFQIHEVQYDKDNNPTNYSKAAATISGEDAEKLNWVTSKIKMAMTGPILWAGFKFPKQFIQDETN